MATKYGESASETEKPESGNAECTKDIIYSVIEKNGYATNREIRDAAGLSRATVQRSVQSMRRAGRIEVCLNGRGTVYIPCGEMDSSDENSPLNFRQKGLLPILEAGGSITKSGYMKKFNISERTASRDLRELCEKNVIKRNGRGRATVYVLCHAKESAYLRRGVGKLTGKVHGVSSV